MTGFEDRGVEDVHAHLVATRMSLLVCQGCQGSNSMLVCLSGGAVVYRTSARTQLWFYIAHIVNLCYV